MLAGSIVDRTRLSARDVDAMHALMARHYDGIERRKFLADLAEKDGALVLRDPSEAIQGFSTYVVHAVAGGGEAGPSRLLFSGDTIVDARWWGQVVTLRMLGSLFAKLLEEPGGPLYWLLLSKGIRTYLLLPLLFRRFSPGGGLGPGSAEQRLLERFATRRYGVEFDARASVVRPASPSDRLKPEWAEVPDARRADPHVRFFLERNPGHAAGEELVSIARVDAANLTPAGRRLVRPMGADERPRRSSAGGRA
jgi:hypothetical protein